MTKFVYKTSDFPRAPSRLLVEHNHALEVFCMRAVCAGHRQAPSRQYGSFYIRDSILAKTNSQYMYKAGYIGVGSI